MLIRRATDTDFDSIWTIFKTVIEPEDTYVFAADTSREDAFSYWFGAEVTTYVAEDQGQVVGMYKIVANQRDRGSHVANASFMVDPTCHGRGIGKAMGLHCLQAAKQLGYLAIQFNFVVSTNHAAIALWEKLGFSIVGTLPKAFHHRSLGYVDAYVMYRLLDEF
ncbi:N-acetyltransferase family protein [Leptolyngbya sp. AN03gr2]|uniref:GNAT family N-acetyltransferase n=1 Tax=unclassified Leptolyngbya TaxID=2650499 RepID=UPI003D3146FE